MSGTGEKGDDTSNLNEFVSRNELLVFLEQAQKNTNRAIATQIAAAFANLNITNMFESLDRRVSALDDRIHALETRPPPSRNHPTKMMIYIDALTITIMVWEVIIMLVMILL